MTQAAVMEHEARETVVEARGRPLIRLDAVRRRYALGEGSVEALKGISLTIAEGEFLAVWGPSGSGKSTLLNMLGLIDFPSEGEVEVAGASIKGMSDDHLADYRNRNVGFVFQGFNLVPVLSALENTMLPLQIQGVRDVAARSRARQCLVDVGLADLLSARPDKMSGGQRQRVAIARALVTNPRLVVADEPTANLDSENGFMVIDLMRRLNRSSGVTFVFATHDQRLLDGVGRRILLRDGCIESDERAPGA